MSSMRVLSPRVLNILARGVVTLTGTANSAYPLANAWGGVPSRPFISAAPGSLTLNVDGDLTQGLGTFEGTFSGGLAPGFGNGCTGNGSLADEVSLVHLGGHAQKVLSGSSGVGRVYKDFLVRAGEVISLSAWLRGDGTATIAARLQDLTTGKWWTGSAWSASVSSWATRSLTSYLEFTTTATVDSAVNLRRGLTTLRASFVVDSGVAVGAGYVDDFALWPAADCLAIFGHNIPLGATVDLVSSTSAGFGSPTTEAAAIPVYQPSFYRLLAAPVARRYWRIAITDPIAAAALYLGQVVLGSTITLAASPWYPVKVSSAFEHIRTRTRFGHQHVSGLLEQPYRTLELPFDLQSLSEYRELRDQLYLAAQGDLNQLVVIPRDDDPELCVFGRLEGGLEQELVMADNWSTRLRVVEHPGPVVGL